MDELTLLRDAHHVDPPDTGLLHRERAALTAFIDEQTLSSKVVRPHTRRRRRTRGPLLAGALAVGVLAGTAAANGLFDHNMTELVNSVACNITTDDARLAASAIDSRGDTIELWILDSDHGFGDLIVEKNPDGTWNGASMGCDAQARSSAFVAGQPYAVAPNTTDADATLVRLYGWVPNPAIVARVTLSNGAIVTADVGAEGYFLQPVTFEPDPNIDVTRIEAVAADGSVVAETDSP